MWLRAYVHMAESSSAASACCHFAVDWKVLSFSLTCGSRRAGREKGKASQKCTTGVPFCSFLARLGIQSSHQTHNHAFSTLFREPDLSLMEVVCYS